MSISVKYRTGIAAVVALCLAGAVNPILAKPSIGLEKDQLDKVCSDFYESIRDTGNKTPIILVHGFNTNPVQSWGVGDMNDYVEDQLNLSKYAKVALNFDYSQYFGNLKWVNANYTGNRLIKAIGCVGEMSKRNGGPGKAIVIGYSMGGLMARYAYGFAAPWGTPTRQYMAKVITIGTPNKGTTLSAATALGGTPAALAPGSKELATLPVYDKDFPVMAIAGNLNTRYTIHDPIRKGKFAVVNKPHGNDAYVSVDSASGGNWTARYGGGNETFICTREIVIGLGKSFLPNPLLESQMPCHHNNLPRASWTIRKMIESIERYTTVLQRESQTSPQPQPTQPPTSGTYSATDRFRNLTWKRDNRLSDPERLGTSDGWSSISYKDPSLGGISSPKEWPGLLRVEYDPAWVGRSSWPDCFADSCRGSSITDMPEEYRAIGSRRAPIAAVFGGNSLAWFYPNEGIIISDFLNSSVGTRDFNKTAAYQSILTMQWK